MDNSFLEYQQKRIAHWNSVACIQNSRSSWGKYYHQRLTDIYTFLVPPGQRIIEFGCARGELLSALKPTRGVGIDFSPEMIKHAAQRYPDLHLICDDVHTLQLDEKFDVIILSDLVNDLWDVQTVFERIAKLASPRSRIILNFYSHLWQPPLALASRLRLATPTLPQNWLTVEDIAHLLYLTGLEPICPKQEILFPLQAPLLATLANQYLVRIWPFRMLALTNFVLARPQPTTSTHTNKPSVSVVIPARNEAGNISRIFERTPEMGGDSELIFVEGGSSDNTYKAIEEAIDLHPTRHCKLLRQIGKGKGDAVRLGFEQAQGDVLMILDADLTVPPEDLPRFYEAICSGKGEFINGVRLVYPMEEQAMRFWNLLGNKAFSIAFSWLLGQSIKDTLCGTKVLWNEDYKLIAASRGYFGEFDPFGDFDLLFGAAKLNLKIMDLPIRYRERTYGDTNIKRWQHGWLLMRMVLFAARHIKFV